VMPMGGCRCIAPAKSVAAVPDINDGPPIGAMTMNTRPPDNHRIGVNRPNEITVCSIRKNPHALPWAGTRRDWNMRLSQAAGNPGDAKKHGIPAPMFALKKFAPG